MKTRLILMTLVILLTATTLAGAGNSRIKYPEAALLYETEKEMALTLENWMSNECYWTCMENNCLNREYDKQLGIDPWMTDVNTWEYAIYLPKEDEKTLNLESWMTDPATWETAVCFPLEPEDSLEQESWMTDDKVWSTALPGNGLESISVWTIKSGVGLMCSVSKKTGECL